MKRVSLVIASLLLSASVYAEALTSADRETLLAHLDKTSKAFLESVEGLSEAQWNYRAAEGRWTIAEVAEHITAAETLLRDMTQGAMKEVAPAEMLKDAQRDEMVLKMIPDRSKTFKAPEPLQPTNRFKTPAATIEAFERERAETVKLAKEGGDLRAFAAKGPMGNLDAYGYLLFLSAHTERHTKQIEEVKADPGFPKQ
jgi:hypothetical protein